MMRGRRDGVHKKRLLTSVLIVAVFLVFLYAYFGAKYSGESALEYGSRSLGKLGSSYLGQKEDSDLGQGESKMGLSVKFGLDDAEDGKLQRTSLQSQSNGQKVEMKFGKRTFLTLTSHMRKSDQNWLVVKGDRINFPGGVTHFHFGAEKYTSILEQRST
ncbi:putative methyltransferase PMT8 [Primulina tabacum]|uniref:putative methyltransferase PMT8 n=1 Tax=Primulina tabacum TaxID=48773 RepID=UPI003F5A0440